MLENGGPPPEPVAIERVCNGVTHKEGYTTPDGNFGIEFGNETGVFQDAGDGVGGGSGMPSYSGPGAGGTGLGSPSALSGSMGMSRQERQLMNCELRAKLAGYRSQSVILAGRRPMDDPNIGVILLHRETPDEGTTVSATSLAAPKNARKAFDKGQELLKKHKTAEAMAEYQKAIELYQPYAAAWCEMGKLQAAAGQVDIARASFQTAIKADPKFVNPYLELALLALHENRWEEVASLTDKALKLDPFDYPQAYLFNAAAYFNMKQTDAAEKSVKEAERLDTRRAYPQVAHLYGVILLQKRDYPNAEEHLRTYLKLAPDASDAATVKAQLEELSKLRAGK
jgi:tetratricopeptide (TPR) repeat protein